MMINSDMLVSMREANQNFSKVARMAESGEAVVILKNNKPHLVLMSFDNLKTQVKEPVQHLANDDIMSWTKAFAEEYKEALSELAK